MNHTALRKSVLIGAIAALVTIGVATLPVAAASAVPEAMSLAVTSEDIAIDGLLPGDSTTRSISLAGSGSVRYGVGVRWTGSAVLAEQLIVTITDDEGVAVYGGSLTDLEVGTAPSSAAPFVLDGDADRISVEVLLPLSAGNEVQGAELEIQMVVEAVGATD